MGFNGGSCHPGHVFDRSDHTPDSSTASILPTGVGPGSAASWLIGGRDCQASKLNFGEGCVQPRYPSIQSSSSITRIGAKPSQCRRRGRSGQEATMATAMDTATGKTRPSAGRGTSWSRPSCNGREVRGCMGGCGFLDGRDGGSMKGGCGTQHHSLRLTQHRVGLTGGEHAGDADGAQRAPRPAAKGK